MAVSPIIGGCDMTNSIRVRSQVKTFAKAESIGVIRIVDSDGVAAVLFHDREARHICRAVSYVDHIFERNRPDLGRHVIVDVLSHVQQTFVNPKQILGLLSVADNSFGERNPTLRILCEFATECSA